MAGIGSAWGSREEMLHPRDRHGRFRKKWSMAKGVVDALTGFLDRFKPHEFQSDGQAAQYTFNRRKGSWGQEEVRRLHMDWDDANETLQAGEMDATTKRFIEMMDRHMVETTDDLIMSQTVPPEAFGLTAQQAGLEDGGLEDFIGLEIADAGYTAMSIGSELSHPPGSVTLRVAVPKGTRAAFGGRSPNDRGVFLDRDQPLVVTKVQSDGRGGWYVLAIAGSGRKTQGATAVADDRTFGRRGPGLTPEQREARIEPRMSAEERLRIGRAQERLAQQETLQGIQARGEGINVQEPGQAPPAPAPAPAAPASPQVTPAPPAAGVPERREPVQSEAVGPGSPEGKAASDIATQAQAPAAPAAPAAPEAAAPAPPSQEEFREATRDLPLPQGRVQRQHWNDAVARIAQGKMQPADALRQLESDNAFNKRKVQREEFPERRAAFEDDIEALDQLADLIAERYGLQRNRGQRSEAPVAPSAPEPTAPSAPRQGPTPTPGAPSTSRESAPSPRVQEERGLDKMTKQELLTEAGDAGRPRMTKAQLRQAVEAKRAGGEAPPAPAPAKKAPGSKFTPDQERRLVDRAKQYRGQEANDEERRIVREADTILARKRQEKEGPIKEELAAKRAAKAVAPPAKKAPAKRMPTLSPDERRQLSDLDTPSQAEYRRLRRAGMGHEDALDQAQAETQRKGAERAAANEKALAARQAAERAAPETRSEMRKRTAGPGLTDEQKADVQAKAARANERARKEIEDFDAKNKADLDPLLEAAGLKESDLDELDKTGANLILGQVREKRISKVEGVRRLRNSSSPQLKALGDALAARPRKVAAKKTAVKAVPSAPETPAPAKVAKKAVPAKAAPSPVDAEKEALKARVAEAGLPDRVTALRALAKEQKIRGFSAMNKEQLQRALLGEEVSRPGKLGVVTPKKMVPHLEAAKSDQEARALLGDHTLTDLRALAKDDSVGVKLPARGLTKDKAKDAILQAVRGEQEGIQGRTPDTSLEGDLTQLGYISLPGDRGDAINREIDQTQPDSPEALRRHRDNLEALSKQYRKDGDKDAANMAQAAADAMGMRAQTISGVEEATPPVKRVAKKAAPAVPEGEEAPEVERPLEKMLKPELLTLAQREGASSVRPSWSKAKILDEIKRNRRMDSSRRGETDEERLRRELGAVPGGAERDLGPAQGPLQLPDRAPTLEEAVPETPPVKKVAKRAAKKAVDQAADTISGQLKETFGDQLRQEDPDSVRDSVRAVGLEPKGNTSEEIFDNALKDMLENRMRELGMLPEDPKKPTRAQKRVPKGSVKGPKADVPITTEGRRSSFTEAWDDQGFVDDPSLNEIRDRVASGDLTHEEGVRRIESEISFNEEEMSDLGAELRGMSPEDRDPESGTADGIHARRAELQDKITSQQKAAKFLRDYSRDEAPVTQEELESKLDGAERAALQRVEVDDLKAAAKAEGLGDIEGDDKDTVVQNIAKKMQAREEKARQRQVRIKERGEVASSLSNLDQMAQNEGSDRALEAGIRRLPEADRQRLTDALGDREQFRRELDAITTEHGLTRVGKAGDTVPYNPDIHEVMGDVAPGSPVLITRAGHSFKPGDGSTVNFKARAIPDDGAQIPARAPEAPAAPAKKALPEAAPGTAAGKITSSRIVPGHRIMVTQMPNGEWGTATRKTGAVPMEVTEVRAGAGGRRQFVGRDDNGNEITLTGVNGAGRGLAPSQTVTLEPAPKAPKATKAAVPTPETPAAPAKKAAKFLPPLASGQKRKSATNVEVGDYVRRASGYKGDAAVPKRVTSVERNGRFITITREDGSKFEGLSPNEAMWIADGPEAPTPAKKVTKKAAKAAADAAAEESTIRGLRRIAEGGFREDAGTPAPSRTRASRREEGNLDTPTLIARFRDFDNPMSRDEAERLLAGLGGPQLRELAKEFKLSPVQRRNMGTIRQAMRDDVVGGRIDSMVTRGFRGAGPMSDPVRDLEADRAEARKVAKAAVPAKAASAATQRTSIADAIDEEIAASDMPAIFTEKMRASDNSPRDMLESLVARLRNGDPDSLQAVDVNIGSLATRFQATQTVSGNLPDKERTEADRQSIIDLVGRIGDRVEAIRTGRSPVPAKKAAKATPPPVVDLDQPTRHNAEVIGTGLDLDPKGEDRQWLDVVQRELDQGMDGRQIADGLRREADTQRTLHNIQESVGGTEGATPAARINRMELMADRLEGVRPIKKAAPSAPAKATGLPDKREMDTMMAATAQSQALSELRQGKSPTEVATKLRQRATSVGSKDHDPETVRPLEFTPSERSAMKRSDARRLRELAAEIQAQGVAQRAEARAAKKAAAPAKKAPSPRGSAIAQAREERKREGNGQPVVSEAVDRMVRQGGVLPGQDSTLTRLREQAAAAPKKRTAAELKRARTAAEMNGISVEEQLERFDQQKEDRKNLTGPVGEMIQAVLDSTMERLQAATNEREEQNAFAGVLQPELRTMADKLGLSTKGTKAQLIQRITDRVKGREAPGASAERAVPSAPGGRTTQPPKPHSWGTGGQRGDQHYYHPDGAIPLAMGRLGDEGQFDVGGGESLHNAMGDIATDAVMRRITPDAAVQRLQDLSRKLPETSRARGTVEALVRDLHVPMVAMPELPADTPAPLRQLLDQIRTGFPIARVTGRYGSATYRESLVDKIADFIREKASGNSSVVGMGDDLGKMISDHSHESQEGSMGLKGLVGPLFDRNSDIAKALQAWAKEIRARRSAEGKAAASRGGLSTSTRKPGKDLTDTVTPDSTWLRTAELQQSYSDPTDVVLTAMVRQQSGWSDPARVVPSADLDRVIDSGWTQMWRGVADQGYGLPVDISEATRTGDWAMGNGLYGNGVYASVRRSSAETYRQSDFGYRPPGSTGPSWGPAPLYEWLHGFDVTPQGKSGLMRMALDPQARIVDYEELKKEHQAYLRSIDFTRLPDSAYTRSLYDSSFYAVMRGYDGIIVQGDNHNDGSDYPPGVRNTDEPPQYLIFNRSVLIFEEASDRYDT